MITPEIRELADGSSTAGLDSSSMMNPPHPVWAGDILQVRAWKDGCGHCWCHCWDHFRLLLNLKSREKLGHFSDIVITPILFYLNQTQCSLFPEYDSNSLTMDWNSKISFSMKSQGFSLLQPPKIMFSSASTVLQLLELLTSIVDWLTVMTEGI